MRITGAAQHEAWSARTPPPIEQVRSGLWSIPVPIPDSPLRYTLSYAFIGGSDVVVVDPGWNSEDGWSALTEGLRVAGVQVGNVTGVVVTHVHLDHHGLSDRMRRESGAWVAMHPAERESLPSRLWNFGDDGLGNHLTWLQRCGAPREVLVELGVTRETFQPFLDLAEPDLLLEHGELLPLAERRVRAVWTPGHTPGHLCLHDETEDVLLTGDHVLPRISPNIAVQPNSVNGPLADYLASLAATAAYDSAEALPAHEYRFSGIAERTADLQRHHRERCQEVIAVLTEAGPSTAWQVTERLSWSRGWAAVAGMMRRAALAETVAHLDYLIDRHQVIDKADDPNEPARYVLTGSLS